MIFFLKRTVGGKLLGGPVYDTADDIFAGAVDDYNKLVGGGGGEPDAAGTPDKTEPETQDVDQTDQGKEQQPETPGKSADDKSSDEQVEKGTDKKEKEKVDGAAEARKWGEGWKKTAEQYEAKIKEVEPLLKIVEEHFGGEENLNFAAEIYRAVANEEEFDAENALEFLSENLPGVATKLTEHITKEVISRATATSLERTFGRKLNDDDIKAVKAFLAAGKPSEPDKYAAFFKSDDIPDELRIDPETGEERDPVILDYIRHQQALLKDTQAQIKQLESRVSGADEARHQQAASEAIERYVSENFAGINEKISELGLDKPIEGETPEIAQMREKFSGLIEGIALHFASRDASFQAMYAKALKATARLAVNPKDRASKADAADFSRRIQAKVKAFAAEAAEVIAPLLDSLSAKRSAQVEKVKQAKDEPDVRGGADNSGRERDPNKDPFDSDEIQREISDLMRARARR